MSSVRDLQYVNGYLCYRGYSISQVLGIEQLDCSNKKHNQKKLLKSDLEYLINEKC